VIGGNLLRGSHALFEVIGMQAGLSSSALPTTARSLPFSGRASSCDRLGDVGVVGGRRRRAIAWPRTQSPERARPDDRVRVNPSVRRELRRSCAAAPLSPRQPRNRDCLLPSKGVTLTKPASQSGSTTGRSRPDPRPGLRRRRLSREGSSNAPLAWLRAPGSRRPRSSHVEPRHQLMNVPRHLLSPRREPKFAPSARRGVIHEAMPDS
jgi:hypothetical protein